MAQLALIDRQLNNNLSFQPQTWYAIGGAVIVSTLTMLFFNIFAIHKPEKPVTRQNLPDVVQFTTGAMLAQGNPHPISQPSQQAFQACYWLFIVTIAATFSSNFIAMMAVQIIRLPINSLEELVAHPSYTAGMQGGSAVIDFFRYSHTGVLKEVWDKKIKPYPNNISPSTKEGALEQIEKVRTEEYVSLGPLERFKDTISSLQSCDIAISKERLFAGYYGYSTHRGFPYTELFNKR